MRLVGRYALYDEIASGGMASVHFGRLLGPAGFARSVAIKRLHPQFAKDPEFVAMFLDEARLAARVRHPNVVPTIDVVAAEGELFLVMEYVQGESLGRLLKATVKDRSRVPPKIAVTIAIQTLLGLHAAHEAKSERGAPLGIIHRDISPQNVLVGDDGAARIVDFGVAKAAWRYQSTREGQLKGKFAYMAPEQLRSGAEQDRRVDVFAASVVLWETLTGKRYLAEDHPAVMIKNALERVAEPPSRFVRGLPPALDGIVLRGMAPEPRDRYGSANDMAEALEKAVVMASAREVAEWVRRTAGDVLERRATVLAEIESVSTASVPPQGPAEPADAGVEELPSSDLKTVYSQVSQPGSVSSASVPKHLSLAPGRRRSRAPMVLAACIALGAAAVAIFFAKRPAVPAPAPPPAAVSPDSASAPAAAATTTTSATAGMSATAAAPVSSPAIAATARKPAKPHAPELSVPFDLTSSATAAPTGRKAPAADCNPPYTIDTDGVRIPKPGCLHR